MNLNPLNFQDYTKKKEMYLKLNESKIRLNNEGAHQSDQSQSNLITLQCDICKKSFASSNKYNEHINSKTHKKNEEFFKSKPKPSPEIKVSPTEEEKTTIDDVKICLFCNFKSESIENNLMHMINIHKFDVPFIFCIKNFKGFLRLLGKKIVTYVACLTCDSQNFKNYKALQNHMIDKQHTMVNNEDLEEFLYKFYDKNSLLGLKDKNLKKLKEYKILKIKLGVKVKPQKKENAKISKSENDEYETVSEEEEGDEEGEGDRKKEDEVKSNSKLKQHIETKKLSTTLTKDVDEDSDEEFEPIELPNGELILQNGMIIGNKLYKLVYKQRIRFNPLQKLADSIKNQRRRFIKTKQIKRKQKKDMKDRPKYFNIAASNKSSFIRINSLFTACKQVNV